MPYLSDLINLILSPAGLIGTIAMAILFIRAKEYPVLRWIGLGIAMYAASLHKNIDPYLLVVQPHIGPIETLIQTGRPLTLALMVSLIVVTPKGNHLNQPLPRPPKLMWPIHTIQALLVVKMLSGGVDVVFITLAVLIYLVIAALGIYGVRRWLFEEKDLSGPAIALTTALLLFCAVVEYELKVLPSAVLASNGRLIGTTGNPQHAAVLLAACLPGPIYLFMRSGKFGWLKILLAVLLISTFHLLLLTGSRTGLVLVVISLGLLFRRKAVFVLPVLLLGYLAYKFLLLPEGQQTALRMATLQDTRTHVWQAQWRSFLANPVFGAPIRGDRLGFGENSWLALLQSTGVIGGALLIWLLASILKVGRSLFTYQRHYGKSVPSIDFCLAGLAALFVGSFLEAYLLGIISLPILAILVYSAASDQLIDDAESIASQA